MNTTRIWTRLPLCMSVLALVLAPTVAQAAVQSVDRPIEGAYIVSLRADAGSQSIGAPRTIAQLAGDLSGFYGGQTPRTFEHAFRGFEFRGSAAAADNLSRDPRVAYVARDGVVTLSSVQTPTPSWGLDRIDQRETELNTEYSYNSEGAGVDLYIVDTGIRSTHVDFGGRVDTVNAFTAVDDGLGTEDCIGHGTVVAGVAGSSTYGVAKGVSLHPVRVVGCSGSGSISNVIAGIDWITSRHQAPGSRRAVVNISLNNGYSQPLDAAVLESMSHGIVFVAAAGNDGVDAPCYSSPQWLPGVLTIGASDETGARWALSNFGSCLDLFAPGTAIVSTYHRNDADSIAMTGTSVAAPHVAGTAALVLAAYPEATPEEVQALIVAAATEGALTDIGEGSPNLLLYSALEGLGGPPPVVFTDGFEGSDASSWSTMVP